MTPDESKADKFKRLAEPRVDSTIKKIMLIRGQSMKYEMEYKGKKG